MPNFFIDFKQVFQHVDNDGDGKISSSELQLCMKTAGVDLSNEDVEALMEFEENGLLGFEGFAKLVGMEGYEAGETKELEEAFRMFEKEGQGHITAESLKQMLDRMGASNDFKECEAMIGRFDLNGDGVLCFDEFKAMML